MKLLSKKYIRRSCKKIIDLLWQTFIDGFFTLLPLCATIGIFSFSFGLLKRLLSPLQELNIPYIDTVPHSEFLLVIVFIFLAGIFLKTFILRSLLAYLEILMARIPLVRPIYLNIKQLVDAFTPSDNPTFKKIMLVEFPRKGMYSIGFLTSEFPTQITPGDIQEQLYSLFIPMTPNPTNGFFIALPLSECHEVQITTQEAMTLVMSGGIIQPDRFKKVEATK